MGIEITAHLHIVLCLHAFVVNLIHQLLHRLLELVLVESSFASDRKYTVDQDDAFSDLRMIIVIYEGTEGDSELL